MKGKVCHLNVSRGGIPKRELNPAQLTPRGLEGDDWANLKYHGGPEQALLLIGEEVIAELRALGYELFAGALGENITTQGLDYEKLRAGQRFRLGQTCEIELTKLREPCRTLDVYNRAGGERIQRLLKQQGRGGWYARVLHGGPLFAGDRIELVAEAV